MTSDVQPRSGMGLDSAPASVSTDKGDTLRPLLRGLQILEAFTWEDQWLGNQEIARRAGLPAPTANRLAKALVSLEYLEHSPVLRKYRLAPGVLSIGYGAAANGNIKEIAYRELQSFANEHRTFVAVCERGRLNAVIVDHCRSKLAVLDLRVGEHVPLAMSAAGWALLAALPAAERDYLLMYIKRRHAAEWPIIARGVSRAMAWIENRGYCTFFGDWGRAVTSVAVPLVSPDGHYVHSIMCSSAGRFLTMKRVQNEVGPALVQAANRIRTQLTVNH